MMDEKLHTRTVEFKLLIGALWKASASSTEKWLHEQDFGITRLQLGLLRVLQQDGAQTITELSRKFGVDPSTLVPTVDILERRELLTRGRDPNDRRRVPLTLTDAGQATVQKIPSVREGDPIYTALMGMGDDKASALLESILNLIDHMPDGAQILAEAIPRLHAHGAKEAYLVCKQRETT